MLKKIKDLLNSIRLGKDDASLYHDFVFKTLNEVLGKRVYFAKKELKINNGRKRVDIVYGREEMSSSFFSYLNSSHGIKVPYIFVEVKNYSKDIRNPEIDQLLGRLDKQRGRFGIIVCRKIYNRDLVLQSCIDAIKDEKFIIVLEETDLLNLINLKNKGFESQIDNFLREKFDEINLN